MLKSKLVFKFGNAETVFETFEFKGGRESTALKESLLVALVRCLLEGESVEDSVLTCSCDRFDMQ